MKSNSFLLAPFSSLFYPDFNAYLRIMVLTSYYRNKLEVLKKYAGQSAGNQENILNSLNVELNF